MRSYDCILNSFTDEYYIGDDMKLQQVLINLISNAVKFTSEKGKVQFMITQTHIEGNKAYFHFIVNDTGIGIAEEFIPKLFDPFELCERSKSRSKLYQELNWNALSALIVDDEIMICQQTTRILNEMVTKAEWVDSGSKAVSQVIEKWNRKE